MQVKNLKYSQVNHLKITQYLLNDIHPDGSSKSKFFKNFGFSTDDIGILIIALIEHIKANIYVNSIITAYGVKFIIDGNLITSGKRNPVIRTIWIVEDNCSVPRLITAYPI